MKPATRRSAAAPRRSALLVALAITTAAAWGARAEAQEVICTGTDDFPCSFQAEAVALQKVPAIFKFQSRVSQAKLPLGEAVFETVYVKLLRGTETLCTEQFSNVTVQNSVLNLEIGRNMSCEIDEVIAENPSLAFQVCLGGQENCLRPLDLAASPYAIKSSFASQAQNAHQADISGQAHYAHRITADRDLLLRNTLGTGYFDFYTHPADAVDALYNAADYLEYANSGFMQWTPLSNSGAFAVHIVAKDPQTDKLRMLDRFVVAANENILRGNLTVTERGIHVTGDSDITGDTTLAGLLLAGYDPANLLGFVDRLTHGIDGPLQVTGATTVSSGGVHVIGDSDVQGSLGVGQINPAFTLDVSGDINFTGQLRRNGEILAVDGAQWSGGPNSSLYFDQGPVGVGTNAPTFPLDVEGDINFTGQLRRNGQAIPTSPWIDEGGRILYPGQVTAERFIGGTGSTFDDLIIGAEGTGFARGDVDLRNTGNQTGLRVFTGAGQAAAIFNDAGDLTTLGGGSFANVVSSGLVAAPTVQTNTLGTTSLNASSISTNSLTSSSGSFSGPVSANSISTGSLDASSTVRGSQLLSTSYVYWYSNDGTRQGRLSGYSDAEYSVPTWGALFAGARLEVNGLARSHWFNRNGDAVFEGSVYANNLFYSGSIQQGSDARIKNIVGLSNSSRDLETLRGLEVTDYTLRDHRTEGGRPQKMLIAQQAERVFPQAVKQAPGIVPDIMASTQRVALRGDELTVTLDRAHNLQIGDRVFLEAQGGNHSVEIVELPSMASFVGRGWKGDAPAEVLVFGRHVEDFRTVNYNAIAMLNVSATQELARKVDNLESLRAELATLRAENERLQRRFAELDQLREEMDAVRAACGGQDL